MNEHRILPRATTVIHDPVDIAHVESHMASRERIRSELGISDDQIAVGVFGRVIRWKGQLEFTKAMIEAIRINPKLRAVIVGDESDGSTRYFASIRQCIEDSGLQQAFILTGYRSNVEEFYAAMDIVVHSSVFPEPFGMVVPEAMAARRPVIASDAGGPRDIIENGVNGILVPPGDVTALADAVTKLAADEGLRKRLGEAGSRNASRFSVAASANRVAEVYSTVLSSARERSG
jgi:glycosyltransferase involved in cell wall biosynthesis